MKHPEEFLAEYVDGALSDSERAVVDAHLATCESCREDVALAGRAVVALDQIPVEPVPFGVMSPVTEEIGRRVERVRRIPWRGRVQWVAGIAVAAALIALVAVSLPHLGGSSGGAAREGTGGAVAGVSAAPNGPPMADSALVGLERQKVDFDTAELQALASQTAEVAKQSQTVSATAPEAGFGADSQTALDCLLKGSDVTANDRLVRLIEATFQGTPAYLGVFLESPGAGQPPTQAIIWVVGKQTCGFLSFSSRLIG